MIDISVQRQNDLSSVMLPSVRCHIYLNTSTIIFCMSLLYA